MKKLILILAIAIGFTQLSQAQTSTKPTTEQKQAINPLIDEGFTEWSKKWTWDKYVSRSAKISKIKVDEDYGDIEVSGDFDYKRLLQVYSGTFTAKINKEGQLVSMTYVDANGMRGSKTFLQ